MNNRFLETEVRCGTKVDKRLKKIWEKELDLLQELLRVCKKYDIKVCAYAGTLLGAVRHKGFIPWDDDMDMCLERKEFNRLLEIAPYEFKEPYFLQTAKSDTKYFCGYARLRNSNTTGIIKWNNSKDYNNGIYIDIFVLDGMPDNNLRLKLLLLKRKVIEIFLKSYYYECFTKGRKEKIRKILKKFIPKIFSYEDLVDKYEHVISSYNDKTSKRTLMTHSDEMIQRYWCYKEDLTNPVEMPFEYMYIPVPLNADMILTNTYGNYMDYPPIEKRIYNYHENIVIFDPDISYKEYFDRYINNENI